MDGRAMKLLLLAALLPGVAAPAQVAQIPAGVPLRIQVDHRYRVRTGEQIEGRLIAPIYLLDHQVLPVNTRISGVIRGKIRLPMVSKTQALLDGDFAPPVAPDVVFDAIELPGQKPVSMTTLVVQRDATLVRMRAPGKRPSLIARTKTQIAERKHEAIESVHHPNLGDRLQRWVYDQLPWHPMMIWTGTEYDARLTAPVDIRETHPFSPLPLADLHGATPTGVIEARLTTELTSATARKGQPVTAVLTKPLLTPDGKDLVIPEGSQMDGVVTQAQPARWFGRNGKLRFTFRRVEMSRNYAPAIHGNLSAAETASRDHVKITDEGTAQATSGPKKYLAPLALGMMAADTYGSDASHQVNGGVLSNGFGFAARVAAMAAANAAVARGFAFYALSKSVYYRWIGRGHDIDFPQDTRLQITLNRR